MNIRKLALLAASAAVLSPAISDASPEMDALNACARAFASSLASPGADTPTYKVVYGGTPNAGSAADYFARAYTFELYANNRRTGQRIARASCSTGFRGGVVALSSIPLDAARPTLALQN